jgi:hypothetical protein
VAEAAFERLMHGQAVPLHALVGQIARDLEVPEPGVAAALRRSTFNQTKRRRPDGFRKTRQV